MKIPVQLNQWNDLTVLRVFLGISNPFLRGGTVLFKGSWRLWQMRTARISQLSITGERSGGRGLQYKWQTMAWPPASRRLTMLNILKMGSMLGLWKYTNALVGGHFSMHPTAEDETRGHVSALLCALKTWAGQISSKRAGVCETWSLLFKLHGHSQRI